jgi:hypothetical protein
MKISAKNKPDAENIGLNTFDYLTCNQKAFSNSDYDETQDQLQSNLLALMKPAKIVRLFRCFACEKSFSAKKMSNCLAVCKACYSSATAENKGRVARNNFVEKTLTNLQKFLRRRVEI